MPARCQELPAQKHASTQHRGRRGSCSALEKRCLQAPGPCCAQGWRFVSSQLCKPWRASFYFLKLFPPCLCATLLPRLPAVSFRLAEGSAPASGKEKLGASAVCGVGAARGTPSSICPSEEPSCAATSPASPAAKALNGAEQVTRCSPSCSFPSCGKRKGNSFA